MELGPGILGNIFDGIQRPLKTIAQASGDCFIPRGVNVPALDPSRQWEFHPTGFKVRAARCWVPGCCKSCAVWREAKIACACVPCALYTYVASHVFLHALHISLVVLTTPSGAAPQVGDRITSGDIYATVQENSMLEHRIMLPPNARGVISYIAPSGHYSIEEDVIEIEFGGSKKVCTAAPCCRASVMARACQPP